MDSFDAMRDDAYSAITATTMMTTTTTKSPLPFATLILCAHRKYQERQSLFFDTKRLMISTTFSFVFPFFSAFLASSGYGETETWVLPEAGSEYGYAKKKERERERDREGKRARERAREKISTQKRRIRQDGNLYKDRIAADSHSIMKRNTYFHTTFLFSVIFLLFFFYFFSFSFTLLFNNPQIEEINENEWKNEKKKFINHFKRREIRKHEKKIIEKELKKN